jgi:hypothetical protein
MRKGRSQKDFFSMPNIDEESICDDGFYRTAFGEPLAFACELERRSTLLQF